MKIVFLGTGGSYPTPKRNVTSIALKFKGDVILFDCGEGTQRQIMKSSLSFMKIQKIFISHFHGDHFLGIPGLIQSMNLNDRENPLEVYGPVGTLEVMKELIDIGYFRPGFEILVTELVPEARLDFEGYSITTIESNHNIPTLGFCFKEDDKKGRFKKQKALSFGIPEGPLFSKIHNGEPIEVDGKVIRPEDVVGPPRRGRQVVYSADTKPSAEIIDAAEDADVLIHDGTLESSLSDKAMQHDHSSVDMAAMAAKEAGVKKLFITHISPRYEDAASLELEAKEIFENSTIPSDLFEYDM
ncbi:MAG: ribonuclease Z [Candidatus Saliniplasma sp.]